ncbi:hypothetical protein E2C01_048463 [Portunus trituberculatus]|uniref:Uncharacterized protein n=1 Tax=Portunus trituberculatus TaxID=210409 RepID=A0A5B7G6H3_PORTR|nr:hypothetical protein [Portunus trituberculatus]
MKPLAPYLWAWCMFVKLRPDDRACPLGSAVGGQILLRLPVNVIHTTELMNSRMCPTMLIACGVRYDP